jgi:RES domain-containing protein
LTVCSYDVDVEDLADLRDDAGRKANSVRLAELNCPWKLDLLAGRVPASWRLAERLLRKGQAGILVPSFAHRARSDMANLVLWRWGPDLPHRVDVHDPGNRLPKDQMSWR